MKLRRDCRKQWRCFHCDQMFRSAKQAQEHFGRTEVDAPACHLAAGEGGLVAYIRKLELELDQDRAESHEVLVAAYAIQSDARILAKQAEERGYDKGVSEGIDYARREASA